MESTTNLKMPLLVSNQSQKEIIHNEALIIIDNILQNGVIDKDLITPPENPNTNDMYIVGEGAIGKWEGKDNYLAFYDNGWRFIEPREGFTFWINDEDKLYTYNGSKWIATIQVGADIENNNSTTPTTPPITKLSELEDVEIIEATQYNILQHNGEKFINTSNLQQLSMVGINTQADENNKLSIKSDYVLFDNNGNSSKIKVNKATETDTASHLFQTNYGGRAEFGLISNDDFTLKVSSDGTNWNNAFVVDKATGNIDFKGQITKNGNAIIQNPWVYSYLELAVSAGYNSSVLRYDLSNYLPNDNCDYEILISAISIGNTNNQLSIKTDIMINNVFICKSGYGNAGGSAIVIVGTGRFLEKQTDYQSGTYNLYLHAYRKII